jgi:hypothetical protein
LLAGLAGWLEFGTGFWTRGIITGRGIDDDSGVLSGDEFTGVR